MLTQVGYSACGSGGPAQEYEDDDIDHGVGAGGYGRREPPWKA